MHRSAWISLVVACSLSVIHGQTAPNPQSAPPQITTAARPSSDAPKADPIPANAPHMSRETRLNIIRDFETQMVYSRTAFPMGNKGLQLKDGTTTPRGQDLNNLLALWGPAIKPGDPAQISFVRIKDNHIHFDLNGGPVRRKKWYQRVQISGANGTPVPLSDNVEVQNPHGSYLDIYFNKYVPEMSAAQLRALLYPVLDFNARNKEEAYLDTVPPKVKAAIQAHHVLVGMNTEMVLHAMGKPPRKVREKDGETPYEEWIYGTPPQDVDFVRIVGDEVVRVETMRVGGQKIVRTEKEIILKTPEQEQEEAEKQDQPERPANAPTLRRPGEDAEDAPKPATGANPAPLPPPDAPPQQGPPGPGNMVGR